MAEPSVARSPDDFTRRTSFGRGSVRVMSRRTWFFAFLLFVVGNASPLPAIAGERENLVEARQLANGAADDLEAQRFSEALEKAKRAEQLYHAPPHLLMIAEALEGLGRLVEALDVYERLAAEPLAPSAPAPFRKARELGAKQERNLLSRVPSMLVDITGATIEEARASVDNQSIALRSGVATRFNPGKHILRVEADGFKPVEVTVVLAEQGGVTKVPVHLEVGNARRASEPTMDASTTTTSRRFLTPALVTLGFGVAAATAGAVTGYLSLSRVDDLKGKCLADSNDQYRCATKYESLITEARQLSDISTSLFIVGGVAAAVGIVLLIPSKSQPSQAAVQIEPLVGLNGAGIRGRF